MPTRQSRVKKKSETAGVAEQPVASEAAAEVPAAAGEVPATEVTASPETESNDEENIYEVMKGHIRRQKEENEARGDFRHDRAGYGRPAPVSAPTGPVIEKVADLTDMAALWAAVRTYLASSVRYLESVLGHCCRVESLNRESGEAVLFVPGNQKGFTNEKARLKIEEALRAVTGLGLKLALHIGEEEAKAPAGGEGSKVNVPAGGVIAQRVAPEVIEAVKQQPVVQELMKRLNANVVNVEMIQTEENDV